MGLHGKILVVGESTELISVRSCQKLSPCRTEPIPAGCKMSLMLAKVEPIDNSGRASGVTDSRRGEKVAVQQQLGKEE